MRRKKKFKFIRLLAIAVAVILFWKGTWGLVDLYLFPSNATLRYVSAITIGLLLLLATHEKLNILD